MASQASPQREAQRDEMPLGVLVYSDDPEVRRQFELAIGPHPAADLPRLEFHHVATAPIVVSTVASGQIDVCVLDGEAWPAGGMGICRQLKDELAGAPPVLLVIGRRDEAWLAHWSRADAVVAHPIDPPLLAEACVELLRTRVDRLPAR